ncbi:hypothetical protein BAE44_0023242 [Dichanthelium oligosanthes]|uniref:Wall-associated receptor kinase galacturonan-binding domain-containing protein n=1 Tax=Dichanthelium oligosanthes TaxID=888268 RepID=A0A1E5US69_9POAL|nr:hypothetical protein BAE44_0023242 [Dichanthelium oligosanthes]
MEFSRLLLLCLPVAVWMLAAAEVAVARSPGCPNTTWCADIEVPYPYGLDEECAIHSGFHLNCVNKTKDHTTKLYQDTVEVTKISVQDNNET